MAYSLEEWISRTPPIWSRSAQAKFRAHAIIHPGLDVTESSGEIKLERAILQLRFRNLAEMSDRYNFSS